MSMLADVVRESLYLDGRLFAWWIIVTGVLEFFFVLWVARAHPLRASLMTVAMNAASTGVGMIERF